MAAARILIVEDETIVAMDLAMTLRRLGYEVAGMTGSGEEAIELVTRLAPDLVLMDVRLKGAMDGIEAAVAIKRSSSVPIIFLTAHGDSNTLRRAKETTPHGYIVKPFDENTIHRVVEVVLGRAKSEQTEREIASQELWKSEERFRLLVLAAKDYAIFMLDTRGCIASWNAGAERMTGYSEEEVIGKPVSMLRPADAGESLPLENLLRSVRERGSAEWEDVGARKNGTRYIPQVYCAPMIDGNAQLFGYVCITRDVTEQRSLEAQLVQAQRLESLGHLAGGVAHDFNNMLMVIFSRCEILLRTLTDEKALHFVRDIRAAAMKNRDLTQQLLAAARRQVLAPQIVDLNEIVRSTVRLLRTTLGENIVIRDELAANLWSVHADPGKLSQVLMNLAINARDAMPDGGTLTVETRNVKVDAGYVRQHLGLAEGAYVSLVVTDTGAGMPKEVRERIFDPFFSTKDPARGTGLGLAVVRGIVEQTGGRIWVYSEPAHGTTFKIFLPRHTDEAGAPYEETQLEVGRGSETVLLVEDEELLRDVIREALAENGYNVLPASGPREALKLSDSFDGPIHLLVTDMIMPEMNGAELAGVIARQRPETRFIFMSGYSNVVVNGQTEIPASARYLEKPIATDEMLRIIRQVLHGEGTR